MSDAFFPLTFASEELRLLTGLALGAENGDTVTRVARGDTGLEAVTQDVTAGDTPELPPFLVRRMSGMVQ